MKYSDLSIFVFWNIATFILLVNSSPVGDDDVHQNQIQQRARVSGENQIGDIPLECLPFIVSKVKDPYHIANLMATCSKLRDFIDAIPNDDESIVNRPSDAELLNRYQPVRMDEHLYQYISQGPSMVSITEQNFQLYSIPNRVRYKFAVSFEPAKKQIDFAVHQKQSSMIVLPIIDSNNVHCLLTMLKYGAGKTYLMYAALRRFNPPPSMIVREAVLPNRYLRNSHDNHWGGFIFGKLHNYISANDIPKNGNMGLDIKRFLKLVKVVLENTQNYLEKIHVRYKPTLLKAYFRLSGIRNDPNNDKLEGDYHVFMYPSYVSAFYPEVPNENGMILMAYMTKFITGVVIADEDFYNGHALRHFLCRFSKARGFVKFNAPGHAEPVYLCHDYDDEIFPDTIPISQILMHIDNYLNSRNFYSDGN